MTPHQIDMNITLDRGSESYELLCVFNVYSWGRPARWMEPPEDPLIELTRALLDAPPWARGRYPLDMISVDLTEHERDALELYFLENYEGDE